MRLAIVLTTLLAISPADGLQSLVHAQAPTAPVRAPAPPAPAPGSAAIYKAGPELMSRLKAAMARTQEMTSSAVANTDQYRVNIINRQKPGNPLAHAGNSELHYIIEGTGTIVTGGRILRPAAGTGGPATIEGGETRRVAPGDVIIVPAGSAHWYKEVEGSITYLEVRFVAPK